MKTVLIIGLGHFGCHVAKKMNELRCEVMAVDIDEERVNAILPYVTDAQIGDGTNEEFLRSLGIGNYDVCFVALGGLFQSSLETTYLLKELGAAKVISRASNDVQRKFLLRNGADEVVYPEKQMAIRTAIKHASDSVLDFIQLDSGHSIYEVRLPREWHGKTLSQIDVRRKYNINIITIKRGDNIFIPASDMIMDATDVAFVIGDSKDIRRCFKF